MTYTVMWWLQLLPVYTKLHRTPTVPLLRILTHWGRGLPGCPCVESLGMVRNCGLVAGGVYGVESGGRVSMYGLAEGLPDDAWDAVAITDDGSVWARSPSRLYRKPPGGLRFVQEKPDIASSVFWGALTAGRDGSVMVPTEKGLAILRQGNWTVLDQQRGLRTSMTSAVLQDREGSL
jgi:hypothetical protein